MSFGFMLALFALDVLAAAAFMLEGKPATTGIWIGYAVAQLGWIFVAKGVS
jgi:hypothetical protein